MVVAFECPKRAWILLIGPHDDNDPGMDVYTELYALAGITTPPTARRTKPPCCHADGVAPFLADEVRELADRAVTIRNTRRA